MGEGVGVRISLAGQTLPRQGGTVGAFGAGVGLGCPRRGGNTAKSWEEAFDFPEAPALGAACPSVWRADPRRPREQGLGSRLRAPHIPSPGGRSDCVSGSQGGQQPLGHGTCPGHGSHGPRHSVALTALGHVLSGKESFPTRAGRGILAFLVRQLWESTGKLLGAACLELGDWDWTPVLSLLRDLGQSWALKGPLGPSRVTP